MTIHTERLYRFTLCGSSAYLLAYLCIRVLCIRCSLSSLSALYGCIPFVVHIPSLLFSHVERDVDFTLWNMDMHRGNEGIAYVSGNCNPTPLSLSLSLSLSPASLN